MKKLALALVLVVIALCTFGCGGNGGLSTYYGVTKKNITKIEYKYGGSAYKTIDNSKIDEFLKTFNVDYTYHSGSGISKSGEEFMITYDYNGTTRKLFLLVQTDKTVVASMYDGYVTIYYVTTSPVEIPISLKK